MRSAALTVMQLLAIAWLAAPDQPARAEAKTPAAAVVVKMTDELTFDPETITITTGQTIEWQNPSRTVHTVTADASKARDKSHVVLPAGAKSFDSGAVRPGGTYRHTFTVPGKYTYFCIPHERQGMIGHVEVRAATQ